MAVEGEKKIIQFEPKSQWQTRREQPWQTNRPSATPPPGGGPAWPDILPAKNRKFGSSDGRRKNASKAKRRKSSHSTVPRLRAPATGERSKNSSFHGQIIMICHLKCTQSTLRIGLSMGKSRVHLRFAVQREGARGALLSQKICFSFENLSAEWRAVSVNYLTAQFPKKQQILDLDWIRRTAGHSFTSNCK